MLINFFGVERRVLLEDRCSLMSLEGGGVSYLRLGAHYILSLGAH